MFQLCCTVWCEEWLVQYLLVYWIYLTFIEIVIYWTKILSLTISISWRWKELGWNVWRWKTWFDVSAHFHQRMSSPHPHVSVSLSILLFSYCTLVFTWLIYETKFRKVNLFVSIGISSEQENQKKSVSFILLANSFGFRLRAGDGHVSKKEWHKRIFLIFIMMKQVIDLLEIGERKLYKH